MKKFSVLLAGGVCATLAFGATTLNDGVLTYDVAESEKEPESATFASHGSVSKVVKKGKGTLVVSADNSAFAGTVEITEGILSMSNGNAAGGKSTTVYVRSGGQLMTTYASAQGDRSIYCPVHIDGDGPDHTGAIFCKYTNMGDNMFQGSVYLDGPATVGGSSRFGFYVVMNGQYAHECGSVRACFSRCERREPRPYRLCGAWHHGDQRVAQRQCGEYVDPRQVGD